MAVSHRTLASFRPKEVSVGDGLSGSWKKADVDDHSWAYHTQLSLWKDGHLQGVISPSSHGGCLQEDIWIVPCEYVTPTDCRGTPQESPTGRCWLRRHLKSGDSYPWCVMAGATKWRFEKVRELQERKMNFQHLSILDHNRAVQILMRWGKATPVFVCWADSGRRDQVSQVVGASPAPLSSTLTSLLCIASVSFVPQQMC